MALALMQGSNAAAIARLRRAVKRLITAEIQDSWKGGGDPADIPQIEQYLKRARKRYEAALAALRT